MGKDTDLLQAIRLEDVAVVMKIVAKFKSKSRKSGPTKKTPLNNQDTDGFSALHHAALSGNCNVLHCLLDSNLVIVDIKDNKGMRPIHYAAWQGKLEPVVLLLKAGASPDDVSLEGDTPLHLASQYGSVQVAKILLQYHADPTIKNKAGKTALDLAAEFGKLVVVNLLLGSTQGGNLIAPPRTPMNVNMHTPLHLAAKNGHSDVIRVLLESGVDINMETHNGTALHEASLFGKTEVVRLLINYGVNVHLKNSHGQTALDIVNKFTSTKAAQEIKHMLREAIGGFRARALQDYCRIHDRSCLSFKAGEIINILEQNSDGRWKGSKETDQQKAIGYFPANLVEIIEDVAMQGGKALTLPSRSDLSDYMQPSRQQSSIPQTPATSNMAPMPLATVAYQQSYGSSSSRYAAAALQRKRQESHEVIPNSSNSPVPPVVSMGTVTQDDLSRRHCPASINRHNVAPQQCNQNAWPRRPTQNGNLSEEESGVDVSSSTESMERKQTSQQHGVIHQGWMGISHSDHNIKPCPPPKPSRSCENVLAHESLATAPQRPYSDCPPLKRIETEIPSLDAKDADRIYEWLKRLRLPEYTNNFTKAGYDMPTIAKMTPEDLTAVGVTVPGHRKKMFAMIQQMKEADVAPNFKPPDVQSWLRILDLQSYYNTLISNGYDQIEFLQDMTWEDLQEIGIIRLGHQKKFMLALKRLREIKKHEKQALDAASIEDLTIDNQKITSSPSFENVTITVRHKSAIQGSLESIGSDISNISGGSLGSKGSNESYPRKLMLQRNPNMAMNNQVTSSYVPCMTTVKSSPTKIFTGPPEKDIPEEHDADSVYQNVSFSTFKQASSESPRMASTSIPPRSLSIDSTDMAQMVHRNSFGSSSTSSGASDQGSLKETKGNKGSPLAIPKRGSSMQSMSDKPLMTATIGRRKSLKQFKAALDNGTAIDALRSTQVPGYATIKRTPSRRTDPVRLHRHLSQERDSSNLKRPSSSGSLTSDTAIEQTDSDSLNESYMLPDVTQSGETHKNIRGSPVHVINRTMSNGNLNSDAGSVPANYHVHRQQYRDHSNGKGPLPNYYQTLRRPPRKNEPLADDFRPRSRSFTDKDEHMQSPVKRSPPVSFRTSSNEGIDKNHSNRGNHLQQNIPKQKNVLIQQQNILPQQQNIAPQFSNDSCFKKPLPPPALVSAALKPEHSQLMTTSSVPSDHSQIESSQQPPHSQNVMVSHEVPNKVRQKPAIPAMPLNLKRTQINNAIKQQQQKLHEQHKQQVQKQQEYQQQLQEKMKIPQQQMQQHAQHMKQQSQPQQQMLKQHAQHMKQQSQPQQQMLKQHQEILQQKHQQHILPQQQLQQPLQPQLQQHQKPLQLQQQTQVQQLQYQQQQHQQEMEKQLQEQVETDQTKKVPGFRVSSFGKNNNPPKKPTRSSSLRLELVTAASTVTPVPTPVNVVQSPSKKDVGQNIHLRMAEQQKTMSDMINYSKTQIEQQNFRDNIQNNPGGSLHKPPIKKEGERCSPVPHGETFQTETGPSKTEDNRCLYPQPLLKTVEKQGNQKLLTLSPKRNFYQYSDHKFSQSNYAASESLQIEKDREEGIHRPKTASLGANSTDTVLRLHSPKHRHSSDTSPDETFVEPTPQLLAKEQPIDTKLLVKEPSVDLYSADFDQLDGMDDAVESDSSDNLDMLSGFENENTDTIKKQPTKQVLREINYDDTLGDIQVSGSEQGHSVDEDLDDLETLLLRGDNIDPSGLRSSLDIPPPPIEPDYTEYPGANLNISEDDLPLPPPPPHLLPHGSEGAVSEQIDVFDDIESMFNNLAEDLASMMK
ncbi:uncharacterized protein LOC117117549 isoform X2 [Anneissia japonica]|uniref:uncharacterized protein LOC117117549 isoform X2 n=1 Tax=Anneissia japonica TaxID=1529436 RepID=UPI0014256D36|nr:uncharacterized protein LOC117117549 isoform X2 [Anneissia japonica]